MDATTINGHPALRMAELDWRLMPIKTREKNPGTLLGAGWQDQASNDPKQIERWIEQHGLCNWGVLLGPASGIIDVEDDSPEGREILDKAMAECGVVTPCYTSGKSIHRLFEYDERMAEFSASIVAASGTEWRIGNEPAQSVVPPSVHPSGKDYEWLPGLSPDDVDVARLPDSMWQLMLDLKQRKADEKRAKREASRVVRQAAPCSTALNLGAHTNHVAAAEELISQFPWPKLMSDQGWKEHAQDVFTRPGDDVSNLKSATVCSQTDMLHVWSTAAPIDSDHYGKWRFWYQSHGYTDNQQVEAAKIFVGPERSKTISKAYHNASPKTEVSIDGILNSETKTDVPCVSDSFIRADQLYPGWSTELLARIRPERFALADEASLLSSIQAAPGRVILWAGEPAIGKTALLMQLFIDAMRLSDDVNVMVANVEMEPTSLMERQLARLSGVDLDLIQERTFAEQHMDRIHIGLSQLKKLSHRLAFCKPPFSIDTVQKSFLAFRPNIVCLDYIQRFQASENADSLTNLNLMMSYARRLANQGSCVFVVSALSRSKDGSGRSSYRGSNSNASFRGSSELEYGADDAYIMEHIQDQPGGVLVKHVKSRSRHLQHIQLTFDGAIQRFQSDDFSMMLGGGCSE